MIAGVLLGVKKRKLKDAIQIKRSLYMVLTMLNM